MTRREWLFRNCGAMLALGLWPGCARWRDSGRGGSFRFVVINDTHFQSPRCPAWFDQVCRSIRSHEPEPEFCLVVGDLAEHGTKAELGAMREVLTSCGMPFHVVLGNHDYVSDADRSPWEGVFPRSANYSFRHRGWQFIGLDSTQGTKWQNTRVQQSTFVWLDDKLSHFDPAVPTILFTHFPLGENVPMRPDNANDLLARLLPLNLVAVFNGHHHGFTERKKGRTTLTTDCCCAISRENHDGTLKKGYFLCTATEGRIERQFVDVPVPAGLQAVKA